MKEDRERRELLTRYAASGASRETVKSARKLTTKELRQAVRLAEQGSDAENEEAAKGGELAAGGR